MAANRDRLLAGLSVLVAGAVCAVSNWGSWRAVLGPIDDHEVVRWQGSDRVFGLGEALRAWPRTEFVPWDINGRYRPSYTLARLVEASIFGGRPGGWYAAHLMLQILSVGLLAFVSFLVLRRAWRTAFGGRESPLPLAVESVLIIVLVVAFAGMKFWNDVVTRLGPSEIYAVVAVAVGAIGAYRVHTDGRARWWVPTIAGFVVGATSKENFAFLVLPLWVVGAEQWRRHRASRATVAAMSIATATAIVVLGAVLVHTVRAGGDVYGRPVGTDRWRAAWDHWSSRPILLAWVLFCVATTCVVLATSRRRSDLFVPMGLALCWPVLRLADTWFNAGRYASHRYLAIHDLCLVAEVVTLLSLVFHFAADRPTWVRFGRVAPVAGGIAVAASLALSAVPVMAERREIAERNIVETRRFQDVVDMLASRHEADPAHQFVMVVDKWSKYEPAVAVTVNLRARGVPRARTFLRLLPGDAPSTVAGGAAVEEWANDGSTTLSLGPIASFSPGAPTTCVFVYGTPQDSVVPQCEKADRISYFTGPWWARGRP